MNAYFVGNIDLVSFDQALTLGAGWSCNSRAAGGRVKAINQSGKNVTLGEPHASQVQKYASVELEASGGQAGANIDVSGWGDIYVTEYFKVNAGFAAYSGPGTGVRLAASAAYYSLAGAVVNRTAGAAGGGLLVA